MQKDLKSIFGSVTGLDQKSVEFLTRAMTRKNLPGFDYLEFKQSLGALLAMDMDEATAFKSAYATASTVGLTKDSLLNTANHYKSVLDTEKKQFDEAHEKRLHQKVSSKKTEVEKLKKQIIEYQNKIEELKTKVAKATEVIENADGQIQAELTKINGTKENFDFTFQSLKNQIDKDIESIKEYL